MADEVPTTPPAGDAASSPPLAGPESDPRRRLRIPPRRLALILGVWLLATGAAIGLASALDSPVGAGAVDEARPVAPEGVGVPDSAAAATPDDAPAGEAPAAGDGAAAGDDEAVALPAFAMVLGRALPDDIARLDPVQQAVKLRESAMGTGNPDRLVELGSVLQLLGNAESARFSYQSALDRDPGSLAARLGLVMVAGTAGGPDALPAVARRIDALAAANPDSQLVAFNQGWVALYRRQVDVAQGAFERTAQLGPDTRLGRTARALLAATEQVEFDATP
ncbi:tetratricopeptide repeat protein [Miltoncostaea oceani]|uniref:tetratricopeptide repeat protein n=1 Tax=Miltoncostaea oceani TaxID=2843216 RepID=UPI001FE938A5|nr:hypothetical protein [Miltoncostaea oceani]